MFFFYCTGLYFKKRKGGIIFLIEAKQQLTEEVSAFPKMSSLLCDFHVLIVFSDRITPPCVSVFLCVKVTVLL